MEGKKLWVVYVGLNMLFFFLGDLLGFGMLWLISGLSPLVLIEQDIFIFLGVSFLLGIMGWLTLGGARLLDYVSVEPKVSEEQK